MNYYGLKGDSNIKYLKDNKVGIWDNGQMKKVILVQL